MEGPQKDKMVSQIISKLFTVVVLWSGYVIRQEELTPATHIYTYRRSGLYSHHGIYVGEDQVIHFTRTGVNKTSLDSFRREGGELRSLHSYAYGRPLLECWLTRWGTRTTLPDTKLLQEVVNKARELYEGNSFGEYDVVNNNCEHFATFCRTGVRASAQTGWISAFQLKVEEVKDRAIEMLLLGIKRE